MIIIVALIGTLFVRTYLRAIAKLTEERRVLPRQNTPHTADDDSHFSSKLALMLAILLGAQHEFIY